MTHAAIGIVPSARPQRAPDGSRWIACRKDSFFLPYLLLSQRFRKKFLWQLRQAFRHGALRFTGELRSLASPAAFEALCETASKIEGVVHINPPFDGPQRVLIDLARYTHRVALPNHRLRALENSRVSFAGKDYAQHGQRKIMTLDAVEFMRRFLLHLLPPGLVRIRQFGFLANRFRTPNLQLCRDLLAVCQTSAPADSHNPADTDVPDRSSCPICKLGRLIRLEVNRPRTGHGSGHFMTLSRDLSSLSLPIPLRASAELCLHLATQRVQVCSTASPAILTPFNTQ